MNRYGRIICIILAALLTGCTSPETPESPATYDEVAETVETTPQTVPAETTLPATQNAPTETTLETAPATTENTAAALPLPTTAPVVTAPTGGIVICSHNYQPGVYQAPTCEQAGYQNFRCSKCGDVQQQLSLPLGHSYEDATCTAPRRCILCGSTQGNSLEHCFANGFCSRCGAKDPAVRTVTIQIKDSKNNPVDGVSVALYIADQLHSTCVSSGGKVTFTLTNHSGSYVLALTGVPAGYKPQKDSYTYRSDNGAIVLDIVPVVFPDDHSKAAYKVGSVMGDFSVTDVDGKTYQLSSLLQQKKLVILNFWYYACVPCKAEFPYFNAVYEKYSSDIEILGLNHFDSESKIKQLRSEMGLRFPLAFEQLGMQQGFGIQSYPVSVFIDSTGRILKIQKDVGFQSEAELETIIRQMLGI